jgi:amino-acid N-acetyltransferase
MTGGSTFSAPLVAAEVTTAELPELAAALRRAGLPADDIAAPSRRFLRFRADGAIAGYAGLEIHGAEALLRSVLVIEAARGRGRGRAIVAAMAAGAARAGTGRLWLLTTTAPGFFARLGFTPVDRALVPPAIAATTEFAALCPASAACMMMRIAPPP